MDPITIFLSVVIFILVGTYLLRHKLVAVTGLIIHAGFVMAILLSLSAIFLPGIYEGISDTYLRQTGVYENLQQIDSGVGQIVNAPQTILDQIRNFFSPQPQQPDKPANEENKQAIFIQLYNNLKNSLGSLLRFISLVLGLLLSVITLYLSYATASLVELEKLRSRVARLEKNSLSTQSN